METLWLILLFLNSQKITRIKSFLFQATGSIQPSALVQKSDVHMKRFVIQGMVWSNKL